METKQTAMYDFLIHLRLMKNQLQRDYQNQRADYYMVRILEGLELKAIGFLAQEKEQINEAWENGFMSTGEGWNGEIPPECHGEVLDTEQYYNETYGK